jgi:hypothetical protein
MFRRIVLAALASLALPAAAGAVTATLPVTCNAGGTVCTQALPVVNPDGTNISGGGGGGGGAVTAASGSFVDGYSPTMGTLADTAYAGSGSGSQISVLKGIYNAVSAPLPAGSALIGNVGGPETAGAAATGGGVRNMGKDGSGNAQDLLTSTAGVLDSPRTGTANRVVTKTTLSANTSTSICPASTANVSTEIYFTTAGVGISLSGGTLTTATVGATAGTQPDLAFGTAGTLYTAPVGITNAITAYGAAGVVVCIQNNRQ